MSASGQEEAVPQCHQRVGIATDGSVCHVPVSSHSVNVHELRIELELQCGIPNEDQILLCGPPYVRLDPRRPMEHYGLPSDSKRVFLYDRRALSHGAPPTASRRLEPIAVELPSEPTTCSDGSRILSESTNPLLRALGEFESHFQIQMAQGEALNKAAAESVALSEACVDQISVQYDAVYAAIDNLSMFKASMARHLAPFSTDYYEAKVKHEKLLSDFDDILSRLKTIELHPILQTDTKKTLFDCVPVEREREWAQQCVQSHTHLQIQVEKLLGARDEVYRLVDEIVQSLEVVKANHSKAQDELDLIRSQAASQASYEGTLKKNLDFVKGKISDMSFQVNSSSLMAPASQTLAACRGVSELYEQQHDLVPSIQRLYETIQGSVSNLSKEKDAFNQTVYDYLKRISTVQSRIRDFENSLAMLKEALAAQKKQFDELEHLEKLPEAYSACLHEISRRIKYGKKFSERIQAMAEELAQLREDEVHQRATFVRIHGQHLPRDFVLGLTEKPSHCEFRMRPFDQSLPPIEIDSDDEKEGEGEHEESAERDRVLSDELVFEDARSQCEIELAETTAEEVPIGGAVDRERELNELRERCQVFEKRIAELTSELQKAKKDTCYCSESCASIARSDVSRVSAREEDDPCDFPLVLALAATAGGMTSSSEAERSNLLEREKLSAKCVKELDKQSREKDLLISKLESENQQFLMNAAAFEEEIQERMKREKELQQRQNSLQQSVQSLQFSIGLQRSSLQKILGFLELGEEEYDRVDVEEYVTTCMDRIEQRIRELVASADAEKVLRQELEQRQDELSMLEVERDSQASFKISFRSFDVGDLALFLPTSAPGSESQRVYLAFHLGCPNRFLSEESISSFSVAGKRYPDYVVGRIVLIDEQLATESHNPYALQVGTTFFVLTVASLYDS